MPREAKRATVAAMRPWFALCALCGILAVGTDALSAPRDKKAEKVLKQALDEDYLETRFDEAEKKLKGMLSQCGKKMCDPGVRARLYMALGLVRAGGQKKLEQATEAFVEALKIDGDLVPDTNLTTMEVTFAYDKAREELGLDPLEREEPAEEKEKERTCEEDFDCGGDESCTDGVCTKADGEGDEEDEAKEPGDLKKNWVSLSFTPDLMLLGTDDACSKAAQEGARFACMKQEGTGAGQRYAGDPTIGTANDIGTGFAVNTMRILVGYERSFTTNISAGARLGFAFGGLNDEAAQISFLPVHVEVRGNYYFGKDGIGAKGFRPYGFVAGGMAQVDARVDVQVAENVETCAPANPEDLNAACSNGEPRVQTLDVWRRAGTFFLGGGLGFMFPLGDSLAINAGLRASVYLPSTALVFNPEAGLAFGF